MKFRKKPVVIEAIQWTGNNLSEIEDFAARCERHPSLISGKLKIPTLEGNHIATIGDWIIKGVHGELYPCKPEIFTKTYEEVQDD